MSPPLLQALAGRPGFAPYGWSKLPDLLQLSPPEQWWRDTDFCQRALSEFGAVSKAAALMVPVLDERALRLLGAHLERESGDLVDTTVEFEETQRSLALIERLAAVGRFSVVGLLPAYAELHATAAIAEPDDLQDTLSDIARSVLGNGAGAIAVRGAVLGDVEDTVSCVASVANYFGTTVLGISPQKAWDSEQDAQIAVVASGEPWPAPPPTLTVTYDDLTTTTTAADIHRWVSDRQHP